MNRSILIVTPFFAPQSHAAVFRAYKLIKYLPQHGWKVHVITVDTNYNYNEDLGLLEALPPDVEVHRTRYVEPSIRGLRMALGGKDRTFKTVKATNGQQHNFKNNGHNTEQSLNLSRRLYNYIRATWFLSPDAYWTWEKPTVQKACEVIRQHQIPLVFTSADPFTSHRIGYQIKQATNISWVADFRDPHTHSYNMHSRNHRIYGKQRQAEQLAVTHADVVTTAAESIALILTETYGLKSNHPIRFIPTGLDENLLDSEMTIEPLAFPYLIFIGEFLPVYGELFFSIFAKVIENPEVRATGIKLLFIGRKDVNKPNLIPYIEKHNLHQFVEIMDHVPQQVLYKYVQDAKATLLVPGKRKYWWTLYAKLVDYIALHKPTIAIVPETSEARTHLQKSGLGIFLDDEQRGVDKLTQFLLTDELEQDLDEDYCNRFLATSQVKEYVTLFDELLKKE